MHKGYYVQENNNFLRHREFEIYSEGNLKGMTCGSSCRIFRNRGFEKAKFTVFRLNLIDHFSYLHSGGLSI